ncbi:NAD-dependent epimerase/dehydratase family protein [Roseovarius aquimarinus]|uniref:NAD-dependent epimerase/dehydratase family protein n=1 Tax=Roseovarius aquimarinus TaxID=1229156 RepID=A0ABW7IAN7_9RHOB
MRVLVIGGTGRVGRMLRRHWDAHPPRGITLIHQARRGGDVTWSAEDGPEALAALGRFDRLLVLAGVTPGPGADMAQNAAIARACHAAAARMGAAHMLFASSAAVYGAARAAPYSERDRPAPTCAYGRAKREAEKAVANGAPPVTALRIGNVLGADMLMLNARAASGAAPLLLDRFGDGRGPQRSYIGPQTLARVLETLLRQGPLLPAALNVGAPRPAAMRSLLEVSGTPFAMRPAPSDAAQTLTLDCSALAAIHAFQPEASDPAAMLGEWRRVRDPQ